MNIHVGRYDVPTAEQRAEAGPDVGFPADHWDAWIEPEDRGWIIFVDADTHQPVVFLRRAEDGGVLS